MVSQGQVIAALMPWLGAEALNAISAETADIAVRLSGYAPRLAPEDVARSLDSTLFQAVYRLTGGRMLLPREGGGWVRVLVEDFSGMADDLMLLAFLELPLEESSLRLLRDYSLRQPSLAALRALCTRFSPLQTQKELDTIAGVVRSCYPALRWKDWLPPASAQT